VAGGQVALRIDPELLQALSAERTVALVSGTNGKTTTTRLLVAALQGAPVPLVTNATGSNMTAGHVAALAPKPWRGLAVLETDEAYLGRTLADTGAEVVVLLNLSRDQLDRSSEVRQLAERWRAALRDTTAVVVANADDPLVVASAIEAPAVCWVGAGMRWRADASGCPRCEGSISFSGGGWACTRCDLHRPEPSISVLDSAPGTWRFALDGEVVEAPFALPGSFNCANATMALAAALRLGANRDRAIAAMGKVREVAGRFATTSVAGTQVQRLLAKNPAGWGELLELVAGDLQAVVLSINARVADGLDPSWLYDVDFEQLRGRRVLVTGDRRYDLSVRLAYAGVDHEVVADPVAAIAAAGSHGAPPPVHFIGNYTAFADLARRCP